MQRCGARPVTLRVRLHLRERILNFSSAMLVSASPVFVTAPAVFVAVPFLAVRTAMLMGLRFGTSARVDMSEVERGGLGQIAHFELYGDPVRSVLEGGHAANARVALGVHIEQDVSTLVISSVLLLPPWPWIPPLPHPTIKKMAASTTTHRSSSIRIRLIGGGYHRGRDHKSSELRWRTHRRRY